MKYKKYSYILILILMLVVGIKPIAAESKKCYYISSDNSFKAALKINWNVNAGTVSGHANVSVDKVGQNNYTFNEEGIVNWWKGQFFGDWNWHDNCITDGSVCFGYRYENSRVADSLSSPHECPNYLVFQDCNTYWVWATDSEVTAKKAQENIRKNGCTGFYASYKNSNGNALTSEEYYSEFSTEGLVELNDQGEPTCEEDFEAIFGSKDDPESIRYLLDTVLQYVRIIVPILIILLGTLDFAKAVLANKEDNIRKAQTDFIKRIIIGIAVFFVPLLVDVIMYLADFVWQGEYIHCGF